MAADTLDFTFRRVLAQTPSRVRVRLLLAAVLHALVVLLSLTLALGRASWWAALLAAYLGVCDYFDTRRVLRAVETASPVYTLNVQPPR